MDITLPEIVSIGIYNSDVAVKNRTVTKKRCTAMFELEIPIENGGVSHMDLDKMPIMTDMLICAKPGQVRFSELPYKCYYIHMIVKPGRLYDMLMKLPNCIKPDNPEEYYRIFREMCKYYDTAAETDEIILHSLILKLVYSLYRDAEKLFPMGGGREGSRMVIENVISFINSNLTSELSLKRTAEFAGFSPVYFHNMFKTATGKTLRDYVEEQRIKKAAGMLISTNLTLSGIAYDCGFSSQSYFSCAFRRRMKMTPGEYRKDSLRKYESEPQKQPPSQSIKSQDR